MRFLASILALLSLLAMAEPVLAQVAPEVLEGRGGTGVQVELGGAYEHLDQDLDGWDEEFARLQLTPRQGASLSAELLQAQRFGIRDTQGRVSGATRLGRVWAAQAEAALAPGATVLPTVAILGNLYRDLGNGFQLGAGGRFSSYESGPVTIGTGTLDYYLPDVRLGYVVTVGFVDGKSAPSHAASFSRYYDEASSLNLIVSNGESVERVAAESLLVSRTRSIAAWGVHWLDSRIAATYGASFNRQEDLFDRTRVQVGVRARIR